MSLTIFSDAAAKGWSIYLNRSFTNMLSSMEKLSSGLSINKAADGPAQLVISEQLRTQIASLNQEIENTSSLIHKYDTASSGLMEYRNCLTELRSLAVGAANEGVNSEEAQQAYDTAASGIVSYYNEGIANAEYNGVRLYDGSEGSLTDISQLTGVDLSSPEAAEASIAVIDEAMSELDTAQVDIGSAQKNELEAHRATLQITAQNLQAAESGLRDTDFGLEFSRFLAEQIRFQAGLALFSHLAINSNSVLGLLKSS